MLSAQAEGRFARLGKRLDAIEKNIKNGSLKRASLKGVSLQSVWGMLQRVSTLSNKALKDKPGSLNSRVKIVGKRVDGLSKRADSLSERAETFSDKAKSFSEKTSGFSATLSRLGRRLGLVSHRVSTTSERVGRASNRVGTVTNKVINMDHSTLGRVQRVIGPFKTVFQNYKQQGIQDKLFSEVTATLGAKGLYEGKARRRYWLENLKRGVPLSAPGAIIGGTLGVLSSVAFTLEMSAGYIGDALTLGAISYTGLWAAKKLTRAKRRGKAFARAAWLGRMLDDGELPFKLPQELTQELHQAMSAYHMSDTVRVKELNQRKAGAGKKLGKDASKTAQLLESLKVGWATVALPLARFKEKRSVVALKQFDARVAARPLPSETDLAR